MAMCLGFYSDKDLMMLKITASPISTRLPGWINKCRTERDELAAPTDVTALSLGLVQTVGSFLSLNKKLKRETCEIALTRLEGWELFSSR